MLPVGSVKNNQHRNSKKTVEFSLQCSQYLAPYEKEIWDDVRRFEVELHLERF